MIQKLAVLFLASGAAAYCEDSFPTPSSGGSWCGPGSIHDGMNCWGSCVDGCDGFSSDTCTIETCGRTTGDGCFPGFGAPLCSWHCPGKLPTKYRAAENNTKTVTKPVEAAPVALIAGEAKPIKPVEKTQNTCLDGGAACAGLDCCFTFGNTDCCCPSGSHCAVHSGTSCGTVCAPGFEELVTSAPTVKGEAKPM